MNFNRLLEYVESLVERRCVRFSKPVLSLETRRDPPSRFSTGGLRQVGEWISTCALVDRVMQIQRLDSDQFYSSDVGCRFVRVLESRVCSLTARQLYQVLVAAKQFKAPVEDIVLNELRPQLGDLGSTELLRLPSLVNKGNPSFWACLSQEVNSRGISKGSRPGVHGMLQNALLESYRSHLNRKLM